MKYLLYLLLAAFAGTTVPFAIPAATAADDAKAVTLHSRIPLGVDALRLLPARDEIDLLASVENPAFEGMKLIPADGGLLLLDSNGAVVTRMPDRLVFA